MTDSKAEVRYHCDPCDEDFQNFEEFEKHIQLHAMRAGSQLSELVN